MEFLLVKDRICWVATGFWGQGGSRNSVDTVAMVRGGNSLYPGGRYTQGGVRGFWCVLEEEMAWLADEFDVGKPGREMKLA